MTETQTPAYSDETDAKLTIDAPEGAKAHPDGPADRLSIQPKSPFYDAQALERGVGIRFRGHERHDVEEYCLSEGWVRVALARKVDRHGQPLTMKLTGPVEAWFRDLHPEGPDPAEPAA